MIGVVIVTHGNLAREFRAAVEHVVGHDSRLSQVITNLLDNAISFSPPGCRVSVKARRVGSEIQVSVEDEGPGIPPENLERIFERFYTDRPQENFGQNSGLGLNISRQIVVAHGGQLWAENRPFTIDTPIIASSPQHSGGARFVIRLPAA
jgi:two-component system sensor histidine kinase ChvG